METVRCGWCEGDSLMVEYHDKEWGTPVHDDRLHFEFLVLETFQAGLNWMTMLKKRENFRKACDNFDPQKISTYTEHDIERLMADPGIIRYRKKIEALINNANRFLEVQKEFGTFDKYIWSFTDGKPVVNGVDDWRDLPVKAELSDELSNDMKKRGFKFVGSVTLYAHLQGIGVVNSHVKSCFRYKELVK